MMEGQTLSHYKVLEKLGGGGMGVVYKALDTHLDRHVALKLLPPELTHDDDARERFVLEAKAASALDHPNICTVYDIDETPDGQLFIAMGYYEGETLKQRVERGPLPVEEALDIAMQMAQGLAEAHAADIVHRDIKPANVMLTKSGLVKIVDFGIAKLLGVTGPTQTGTTLGTVSYMSPEQVAGENADQQSDVWSLGAVLYEILTGQQAFNGESQWAVMNAISQQQPDSPSLLRGDVPSDVDRIVEGALEKTRDQRWQSASQFLQEARTCHTALTRTIPEVVLTDTSATRRRMAWAAGVGLIVVVALFAVGLSWLGNRGEDARWARNEALPEITRLVATDSYLEAIRLTERAEALIPDDPELTSLWSRMSIERGFATTVPGSSVSYKPFFDC